MLVNQLVKWDRHLLLNHAGIVHMAGNGKKFGARIVRTAKT